MSSATPDAPTDMRPSSRGVHCLLCTVIEYTSILMQQVSGTLSTTAGPGTFPTTGTSGLTTEAPLGGDAVSGVTSVIGAASVSGAGVTGGTGAGVAGGSGVTGPGGVGGAEVGGVSGPPDVHVAQQTLYMTVKLAFLSLDLLAQVPSIALTRSYTHYLPVDTRPSTC